MTTKRNPDIYKDCAGLYSISFKIPNGYSDPLWLTEQGLKNLAKVSLEPKFFASEAEAIAEVRNVVIPHIIKEREQGDLVKGW